MTRLIYANTNNSDMYYAVKGVVPDAFYYIDTGTKKYVYLDSREYGVFKEENKNLDIELVLLDPIQNKLVDMKESGNSVQKLGLYLLRSVHQVDGEVQVPTSFPLDLADYLRSQGINIVPVAPFFSKRLHKSVEEVNNIRENLRKTQDAFKKIEEILLASSVEQGNLMYRGQPLTSEFLKREVEQVLLSHELFNTEGLIVSCGVHAAIPHHRGKGIIRADQTIICDLFPRHRENGYFADMTRTYFKGIPSDYQKKMYVAVQEAQEKAIAAIKPGMTVKQIHQICVDHFLQNGFDVGLKGFVHGTGHGLGVDIHESPFMNARSMETLEEGMVVTVEPGLYYEEYGGVRIEDVVVVTKDGCKNLTNYPKQFVLP